ncbi:MAG TPA: MipA/OmpV family protein [Albitalea sp.]
MLPPLPWRRTFAALPLLLAGGAATAQASSPLDADNPGRPAWEAGFAAGGGRVADYPGADESHTRAIVVPVVIYRGPILRVDQGGIRGRLVDSPDWEFNLSATAAFSARDSTARQGMPGLDYLFGVGPQLIYKGLGATTLHLKARALMSTDFRRIDGRGVSFDPEVRWRTRPFAGSPSLLTLSLQPTWATRELQRYFYQVDASQATPQRPAHRARAGYLGTELALTLSGRRSASLSWFVTARGMSLHGAANASSPLLRDKSNFNLGAGLVWMPWRSSALAPD